METNKREEIRRLKNLIMRLTAEIGGKNQKTEYIAKQLEVGRTKLSEMKKETDQLDQDYKQVKRNVKMTTLENQRLEREIENQKREIQEQGKEIKKRDGQLDFKNKQILVLRMLQDGTEAAPQKGNTVQAGRHQGVQNMSSRDNAHIQIQTNGLQIAATNGLHQAPQKVKTVHKGVENRSCQDKVQLQADTNCAHIDLTEEEDNDLSRKQTLSDKISTEVQIDTNGLRNEVEQKDYELSRKQTLGNKEHRNSNDLQKVPKVSIVEIGEEDSESSLYILDDWRLSDCDFSDEEECNSVAQIPPPESSVDPCNEMQNNSSHLPVIVPDSEVKKGDECVKGDIEGSGGVETVECNASEDMPNNCSDLSSVLPVTEVKDGDIEGAGGVETVECNAFQDMFPLIAPQEPLVDPFSDLPNNCSDFSFVLPDLDCDMTDMDWLSTFVDDSMSAGDITMGIDFADNNKNGDSATILMNSSSSCSGGMTMPLSASTVVHD